MKIKKIFFTLTLALLMLIFLEISCHILYRAIKKVWIWEVPKQHDVFNIRAFTKLVPDERIVTNKHDFNCIVSKNRVYLEKPRNITKNFWNVSTDKNGFRIGLNRYYQNLPNIIFLGDSVPFGWGENPSDSVPSKFYEILINNGITETGVMNAAIPSYSLYQAVKRYEYEINGKYPAKAVLLQILDPAPQFLNLGAKWNKTICWASKDTLINNADIVKESLKLRNPVTGFIKRYSSIYHFLYTILQHMHKEVPKPYAQDALDPKIYKKFETDNIETLKELVKMTKKDNAELILLSINILNPISTYSTEEFNKLDQRSQDILILIEKFNNMLKSFADNNERVHYIDVSSYFDSIGREGLFNDETCHLSPKGAEKQAEFVYTRLKDMNII